ncbi:unnamed protein product [Penicillium roqueforti FM164]|uniref:Uncharacterized protein n=1 Tax=Penicillium roqueforti (strain FM164) TaxID=1365484 RepID=W6QQV4_PENRF|nr:unnamed protein product [Penicillium roqueforti FM164]
MGFDLGNNKLGYTLGIYSVGHGGHLTISPVRQAPTPITR